VIGLSCSARRCFVDTSAFFAITDRDDSNHHAALAIAQALGAQRWRVFTSTYVIAEQHALHLGRLGRDTAYRALSLSDQSGIRVVRVGQRDEVRAREILVRYTDKQFSFTDATSFSIMERLRMSYAFSFDR
jgi:predicted nucleic acid-binding protein